MTDGRTDRPTDRVESFINESDADPLLLSSLAPTMQPSSQLIHSPAATYAYATCS